VRIAQACAIPVLGRVLVRHTDEGVCELRRRRIDRQMRRAQAEQLSDPTGSRARWQRVERELTDAAPWVPLVITKDVNFLSERVGNYQYSPQMGMLIDQLWVR
jgi:hypothetical protein